jgi:hypothetical protein
MELLFFYYYYYYYYYYYFLQFCVMRKLGQCGKYIRSLALAIPL